MHHSQHSTMVACTEPAASQAKFPNGRKQGGGNAFKLAAVVSVVVLCTVIPPGFWTRKARCRSSACDGTTGTPTSCRKSNERSDLGDELSKQNVRQGVRLPAPSEEFGCISQRCWAGVYVDSASKSVLHLARGGGAFFSPGTAAGSHGNKLRWKAKKDFLYMVDSDNKPFSWPGAASYLRRDPVQAGKLAGFGVEVETSNRTALVKSAHLSRDSLGIVYPGCTYVLSWRPGQPFRAEDARENRVVVNRDGTITDAEDGRQVARWSFPEPTPVVDIGDNSWATGDEVVLLLDGDYLQFEEAGSADGGSYRKFKLSSPDGGRTWVPPLTHCQTRVKPIPDICDQPARPEGCVVLALVLPADVSMFPLTSAMQPIASYLNGAEAQERVEGKEMTASGGDTLQPIVSIFETQPYRSGSGDEDMPEQLEALIVICRAVPRPTKTNEDLSCVINGIPSRASWLSWSMILCSTTHIKPKTTLYIAFRGRPFSWEATFRRAPPPRHIRLAWPESEAFDALLPNPAQTSSWPEPSFYSSHRSAPGVPTGAPFGSSMVICTMFKNEAPYLEEWLQYHQLLGVSKVYMYDNNSSDRSRKILRKFELSKFVRVLDWPYDGGQTEALNDCLCRFRHTTRWMSFVDVDEFVDPAPSLPMQATNLRLASVGHLESPRIQFDERAMGARRKRLIYLLEQWAPERHTHCFAWVNYCSHGQLFKSGGGVIETFLELEDMGETKIHMQKPFFKGMETLTLRRIGPHFLLYSTEDIDVQYDRHLKCPYAWLDPGQFQIRHYRSKSLEEYVQRRAGTDSAYKRMQHTKEQLALEWRENSNRCGRSS